VVYPNGGTVHLFSAEEPDRLRGPNLDGLWIAFNKTDGFGVS
jgi:phage terminase large subunit-like protein